jgi:hypothetical protein
MNSDDGLLPQPNTFQQPPPLMKKKNNLIWRVFLGSCFYSFLVLLDFTTPFGAFLFLAHPDYAPYF